MVATSANGNRRRRWDEALARSAPSAGRAFCRPSQLDVEIFFESGHLLTAGHRIQHLLAGFLAATELGGDLAPNQRGKVVSDRQRVTHVMGDGDDRGAFSASLAHEA
ncbi:MAG: hypothetical protein WDM94_00290 [Bauldia sp.]